MTGGRGDTSYSAAVYVQQRSRCGNRVMLNVAARIGSFVCHTQSNVLDYGENVTVRVETPLWWSFYYDTMDNIPLAETI